MVLDTSIRLSKPDDHTGDECYFRVDFTKARSCYGEDVKPFTAKLIKAQDGAMTWAIMSIEESTKDRLINLIADSGEEGISVTQAADALDVNHSLISRLRKQLENEGLIRLGGRKTRMVLADNWSIHDGS
jgi:hypothetical protein